MKAAVEGVKMALSVPRQGRGQSTAWLWCHQPSTSSVQLGHGNLGSGSALQWEKLLGPQELNEAVSSPWERGLACRTCGFVSSGHGKVPSQHLWEQEMCRAGQEGGAGQPGGAVAQHMQRSSVP